MKVKVKGEISNIDNIVKEKLKPGMTLAGFLLVIEFNEACDPTDELHCVSKTGRDLGDFTTVACQSSPKLVNYVASDLLTLKDLKQGVKVNIDMSQLQDYE